MARAGLELLPAAWGEPCLAEEVNSFEGGAALRPCCTRTVLFFLGEGATVRGDRMQQCSFTTVLVPFSCPSFGRW